MTSSTISRTSPKQKRVSPASAKRAEDPADLPKEASIIWDAITLVSELDSQRLVKLMGYVKAGTSGSLEIKMLMAAIRKLEKAASTVRTPSENPVLKAAREQAQNFKQSLVEQGEVVTSAEMCQALNVSRQAIYKAVASNRLFYLEQGGDYYYPVFFADPTLDRKTLEKVSKTLGNLSGSEKWQFFTRPKGSLSGKTPLEALKAGLVDDVLNAAAGFSSR